jgi:DNA-binding HxlR family transcriptional regulator
VQAHQKCVHADEQLVERRTEARLIEYDLTDLGRTLVDPIEVLTSWARDHGEAIVDFQRALQAAV